MSFLSKSQNVNNTKEDLRRPAKLRKPVPSPGPITLFILSANHLPEVCKNSTNAFSSDSTFTYRAIL
jgi:hypothetical protein